MVSTWMTNRMFSLWVSRSSMRRSRIFSQSTLREKLSSVTKKRWTPCATFCRTMRSISSGERRRDFRPCTLFWWWVLDRSIDDRAWWAYHHRYDMDPARYQALVANDQQLESRVAQLEAQQAPRDPNYTPPGVDRDLMYSDHYVEQAYSNRPTTSGVFVFWLLAVPTALGVTGFFIWLIWFKRWQTATPVAA